MGASKDPSCRSFIKNIATRSKAASTRIEIPVNIHSAAVELKGFMITIPAHIRVMIVLTIPKNQRFSFLRIVSATS